MSVDKLPAEILAKIFDNTEPGDIPKFLFVNRHFRDVARSQLYLFVSLRTLDRTNTFLDITRGDHKVGECVRKLQLMYCGGDMRIQLAQAMRDVLRACSFLNELDMDFSMNHSFMDDSLIPCLDLVSRTRLTSLRMVGSDTGDEILNFLATSTWFSLESLWLGSKQPTSHASIINLLQRCPKLTKFQFERGTSESINDFVLDALADHCTHLHSIAIGGYGGGYNVSKEGLVRFVYRQGRRLRNLSLLNRLAFTIDDSVIVALRQFAPNIECVYLESCADLRRESVSSVVALLNQCRKLERLDIIDCDESLGELLEIAGQIRGASVQGLSRAKAYGWIYSDIKLDIVEDVNRQKVEVARQLHMRLRWPSSLEVLSDLNRSNI